jgi:hypothetical protein
VLNKVVDWIEANPRVEIIRIEAEFL